MTTITIPKKLTKGEELIIIPRKVYEEFLALKSRKESKIDKDLEEALEDIKNGRLIGPFMSIKEGLRALKQAK